jgi:hypothetical protein
MSSPADDKTTDTIHSFCEEVECVFDQLPKYQMKILLDFNANVSREYFFFKLTIGTKSLQKISNDIE